MSEFDDRKLIPNKNANYWIYVFTNKLWTQYVGSTEDSEDDKMYISSYSKEKIKKNDIIFYYVKDKHNSGFTGIAKAASKHIFNKENVKIFKDKDQNKNMVRINYLDIFDENIKLSSVFDIIQDDIVGQRNRTSFTGKFLKKIGLFIKLNTKGKDLLNKLYELTDVDDDISDIDDIDGSDDIDNDINEKNNNKKKDKKGKICNDHDNDNDDIDNNNGEEIEAEVEAEQAEQDDESDENGQVPIMITLCEKYEWDYDLDDNDILQMKRFLSHIIECKDCIKIDNGTSGNYDPLLSNKEKEYYNYEDDDADIEIAIDYYVKGKRYDPKSKSDIKIVRINNNHEIFDECVMVLWNNSI